MRSLFVSFFFFPFFKHRQIEPDAKHHVIFFNTSYDKSHIVWSVVVISTNTLTHVSNATLDR